MEIKVQIDKYRYDFAVATEASLALDSVFEHGCIPEGLYATVHVEGDLSMVASAWDYLYKSWLPNSGYLPRHFPALEEFLQGPEAIGWDRFNIKCRIPIINI